MLVISTRTITRSDWGCLVQIADIFKKVLTANDQNDISGLIPVEIDLNPGEVNRQPEKHTLVLDKTIMVTDKTQPDELRCHWDTRQHPYEFGVKFDNIDIYDWVLALALVHGATKIVWRVSPLITETNRMYAVLSLHK